MTIGPCPRCGDSPVPLQRIGVLAATPEEALELSATPLMHATEDPTIFYFMVCEPCHEDAKAIIRARPVN